MATYVTEKEWITESGLRAVCLFVNRGGVYPAKGDEWWFGFDCAHTGDKTMHSFYSDGVKRTADYVIAECESLARQLSDIV